MTEITDNINIGRGLVFFDAACGLCRGSAGWLGGALERRGFVLLPLQSADASALTGASKEELLHELHVVTTSRQVMRGIDAVLFLAAGVPWGWPLRWLAAIPGMKWLLDRLYRAVAARRYRISAACRLNGDGAAHAIVRWIGIFPVLLSMFAGRFVPAWVWMWAIAFALFFACKWATWWPVRRLGTLKWNLPYFFAWTGMDAESFLAGPAPARPTIQEWLAVAGKTLSGAALIWIVARRLSLSFPTFAAWAGMIGAALLLHFGLMHAIALAWRRAGVAAEPLMRQPARSTSLAEFWGRRWNTGFRFLAHDLLFRRFVRRLGIAGATAAVFAVSGVIHDAVISIPARGGYGLPTIFFLLQIVGVLFERTAFMRRAIRRPVLGWTYVFVFTVVPMPLLFHPAFVHRVIVPFLHAIGGLR